MNSISTLAATSTVAVAGIGWCFSCENQNPNKRKLHPHDRDRQSPQLSSRPHITTTTPNAPPSPGYATSYSRPRTTRPPNFSPTRGGSTRKLYRRRTRVDRIEQGPFATEQLTVGLPRPSDLHPRASLSSRRSWLNRLSSYSQSPATSLASSPGQQSPSISVSNGSAAPILSARRPSTALPPNKLVKRSASQTISRNITSSQGVSLRSSRPTLRRPATSHQRSATLQQQFLMDEARLAQLDVGPQSQGLHHSDIANQEAQSPVEGNARNHYFKPRRMRVRKGNAFSAPNSQEKVEKFVIRTIAPESIERAPYLTLPDSVESLSSDEERAGTLNWVPEDTFIFRGRPESSSLFTEQLPVPQPSSQSKPQRKQPRHSFSVSDMFVSASPSRKNKSAGQEGGPSARLEHGKRRASIPTNELPTTPQPSSDSGLSSRVTANSSRDTSIPRSNSHSQRNSPSDHQLSHSDLLPQFSDLHLNSGGRSDARDRNTMMTYTTTSRAPSNPIMTSPLASSNKQQGQRLSFVASSERASTLLGSDGEGRGFTSGDDDEMSETVFDSLRTGATNSSLGTRGPRADRIFDENAQIDTEKTSLNAFHGLTINDTPPSSASITRQSNHDEHELLPTAGKDFTSTGHESSDETRAATRNDSIEDWASAHSRVEDENRTPNRGLSNHDDDDDDEEWERNAEPRQEYNTPLSSPSLGRLPKDPSHPPGNAPHQQIHSKKMVRDSLFDWAEQSQHDRNGSGGYRPQTVHGKRANGARGGRSDGRRGPSALHVRSQSVPVVPDVEGNREHATNKFGTWGLGSKVVSEDWDNDYDFDFDLAKAHSTQDKETSVQTVSAPVSMIVPKAIKESQASVIGNLGYIREFALLVENLKRLRARAAEMRIIEGPAMDLWKEAEAMIDLATVDNDEPEALTQTISANGLHLDGFDDEWTPISFSPRGRRKSVLALEDDIFGSASEPILPLDSRHSQDSQASKGSQTKRKQSNVDTASIAKSVIETMQHRRQVSNTPIPNPSPSKSDKLSFDTTTLHDLVAHVNTLARKLAEIIRENDGTAFESRSLESGNAITKLFVDPSGV